LALKVNFTGMEYRITIGDYGKLIRVLKQTLIIGISAITIFTFLATRYFAFPSTIGLILFPLSILAAPLYSFIRLRRASVKEPIIAGSGYIAGRKYGKLEFKNIKSYKHQTFGGDVLILEMYNGTKYAITYDMKNFGDYYEFKKTFSKMLNEENQKRKSMWSEEIIEKRSFSKCWENLRYYSMVLGWILFIIYLIYKYILKQ
jgi:hypothetical protein